MVPLHPVDSPLKIYAISNWFHLLQSHQRYDKFGDFLKFPHFSVMAENDQSEEVSDFLQFTHFVLAYGENLCINCKTLLSNDLMK